MKSAVCLHCNAPFAYVDKGKVRRFCSHECYASSMVGTSRGGFVTLVCPNCNKEFTRKRFYIARKDGKPLQRFCSRACATPAINAAHVKHQPVACLTCGKVFQPKSNNGRLSEFCSRVCAGLSGRNTQALIAKQQAGKPTSIEQRMMDALDAIGVQYRSQYPIFASDGLKRYVCDIAITESMLIVECDGDYWHSLPKSITSDKRKDKYLKQRGYKVLRFTETQINQDAAACAAVVVQLIQC